MKKLALLLVLATAPLAHAQEDRGMYFGAGLGSFDYDESSSDITFGISDSTYAYHLLGGYKFTENFALEVGLGGTGDIEENVPQFLPGIGDDRARAERNLRHLHDHRARDTAVRPVQLVRRRGLLLREPRRHGRSTRVSERSEVSTGTTTVRPRPSAFSATSVST